MTSLSVRHATGAPEPVRFAASELAAYLGRMAGQPIAVVAASGPGWPQLELRVGPAGRAAAEPARLAEGLASRVRPLPAPYATTPGPDAFLWRTGGGEAAIAGTNGRSVLFGVYDLLEGLGCRFFGASDGDEVVPRLAGDPFTGADERFEQATFPFRERHF
ncbi:MAG TPA: hypothetical protein VGL23_00705, partial [Chloroflexota bacterium]